DQRENPDPGFVLDAGPPQSRIGVRPPSTDTTEPVVYVASRSSHSAVAAISSTPPVLPSAVWARMRSCSAGSGASAGHRMAPGAIALTRSAGASATASARVIASSPPLLIA